MSPPFELAPGATQALTVNFAPTTTGEIPGAIRVGSTAGEVDAAFTAVSVAPSVAPPGPVAVLTAGAAPKVVGAIDKSAIDEVIKRGMPQLRYCYQRELTQHPEIAGKLTVKFVISQDGAVTSAATRTTTLNNPAVESCVNGQLLKMEFPKPQSGGIVTVSYPFVFSPG